MKAIILDDEMHCIETLSTIINKYTDIQIVAQFSDALKATKEIRNYEADILFLDIEMPFLNGFEFLQIFPDLPWQVIFTTAYDEYAVKAFKVNAIDYLLKPILKADLITAIDKCKNASLSEQSLAVRNTIQNDFIPHLKKIAIPSLSGLELVSVDAILYLESDSNYTKFKLDDGSVIVVSKTMKTFETMLKPFGFIRIHHSNIVNPNHIKRYVRGDGGYVILDNDEMINVSRARKDDLLKVILNNK